LIALRAESAVGGREGPDGPRANADRGVVLGVALGGLAIAVAACAVLAGTLPRFAAVFALAPTLAAIRFVGMLELAGVTDEGRANRHGAITAAGNLIGFALTIGFISALELGWAGRILALVVAEGGVVAVRLAVLAHRGTPHRVAWHPARAGTLIRAANPELVASVLGVALDHASRLVALGTLGMAQVGFLVVAYRVGVAVPAINNSLTFALGPRVWTRMDAGDVRGLVRLHLVYGGAMFVLGLGLAGVCLFATDDVFGAAFGPAAPAAAAVAVGYGFKGFQRVAGVMRTRLGMAAPNPWHVAFAVALVVAAGLGLAPTYGVTGLALATTLGLATVALLSVVGAYREWARRRAQ
ncbi:MAG: hypothetical protein ACREER_10765, partial [Alphaproteobacteria bacterium]